MTFIGDNRGFQQPDADPLTHNYRTMMDWRVDWENETNSQDVEVGETQIVSRTTGEVLDSRYASKALMGFDDPTQDADFAAVTFKHLANDPFCPVWGALGAIAYQVKVSFYRSGMITVVGQRFAMPAHEGWVRWNDEATWTNVFELQATTLACLVLGAEWIPTPCVENISTRANRSTDTWSSFDGAWGTTAAGKIWGTGVTSRLAPHGGGSATCYAFGTVRAPSLPTGVAVVQLQIADQSYPSHNSQWATALGSDGHIYTWGSGLARDMGRTPSGGDATIPTAVDNRTYVQFSVSLGNTFAVTDDGDVYTWGRQFDDGSPSSPTPLTSPTLSLSGENIQRVAVAPEDVVALDADGHLHQFGQNSPSDGNPGYQPWHDVPVSGVTFSDIAANGAFIDDDYALDTDGHLWAWNGHTVVTAATGSDTGTRPIAPSLIETTHTYDLLTGGDYLSVRTTGGDVAWWNAYRGPLYLDTILQSQATPPVALHARTMSTVTRIPVSVGIDDDGNAWALQPTIGGSGYTWTNLGLPPSKDQQQPTQCYP